MLTLTYFSDAGITELNEKEGTVIVNNIESEQVNYWVLLILLGQRNSGSAGIFFQIPAGIPVWFGFGETLNSGRYRIFKMRLQNEDLN